MTRLLRRKRTGMVLFCLLLPAGQLLGADTEAGLFSGLEVGGRLHEDFTRHRYDPAMGTIPVDGYYTRRARISVKGSIGSSWDWDAEYDFAGTHTSPKDVKLRYEFADGTRVYLGHMKQPYSLSLEMSSNDIAFIERSIDNKLVDAVTDRAKGVRLEKSGSHWFLAVGAFGEAAQARTRGNDNWSLVGRLVGTPVKSAETVLHLGFRSMYRKVDAADPLSFSAKTTSNSDLRIASTGALTGVDSAIYAGPEFGFAHASILVLGEYNHADFRRPLQGDLRFSSWHLAASWFPGGEITAAAHDIAAGEFKYISPQRSFSPSRGQYGALELAVRLAGIDLNDAGVHGGNIETFNAAANWYLNDSWRLQLDWTRILDADEATLVRRYAPDINVFTTRIQYVF